MNNNVKKIALLSLPPITCFLGDSAVFYTFDLNNKIQTVRIVLLLLSQACCFQYNKLIVVFLNSYYLVAFIITK